jgi:hypothetical protein
MHSTTITPMVVMSMGTGSVANSTSAATMTRKTNTIAGVTAGNATAGAGLTPSKSAGSRRGCGQPVSDALYARSWSVTDSESSRWMAAYVPAKEALPSKQLTARVTGSIRFSSTRPSTTISGAGSVAHSPPSVR